VEFLRSKVLPWRFAYLLGLLLSLLCLQLQFLKPNILPERNAHEKCAIFLASESRFSFFFLSPRQVMDGEKHRKCIFFAVFYLLAFLFGLLERSRKTQAMDRTVKSILNALQSWDYLKSFTPRFRLSSRLNN
jgi:hypothetical protein